MKSAKLSRMTNKFKSLTKNASKWAIKGHYWITFKFFDPKPQFCVFDSSIFLSLQNEFSWKWLTNVFFQISSLFPKMQFTFNLRGHKIESNNLDDEKILFCFSRPRSFRVKWSCSTTLDIPISKSYGAVSAHWNNHLLEGCFTKMTSWSSW